MYSPAQLPQLRPSLRSSSPSVSSLRGTKNSAMSMSDTSAGFGSRKRDSPQERKTKRGALQVLAESALDVVSTQARPQHHDGSRDMRRHIHHRPFLCQVQSEQQSDRHYRLRWRVHRIPAVSEAEGVDCIAAARTHQSLSRRSRAGRHNCQLSRQENSFRFIPCLFALTGGKYVAARRGAHCLL